MQHPQRQSGENTRGIHAGRNLLLTVLVLLSMLAGLTAGGAQLVRYGLAEASATAPIEERQGGDRHLEEESPAKLRRVSSLSQAKAAQPLPASTARPATPSPTVAQLAILEAHSLGHPLPSQRQQRGQAPPQA